MAQRRLRLASPPFPPLSLPAPAAASRLASPRLTAAPGPLGAPGGCPAPALSSGSPWPEAAVRGGWAPPAQTHPREGGGGLLPRPCQAEPCPRLLSRGDFGAGSPLPRRLQAGCARGCSAPSSFTGEGEELRGAERNPAVEPPASCYPSSKPLSVSPVFTSATCTEGTAKPEAAVSSCATCWTVIDPVSHAPLLLRKKMWFFSQLSGFRCSLGKMPCCWGSSLLLNFLA